MKKVFVSHPYSDYPHERKLQNKRLIQELKDDYEDVLFLSPLLLFDYLDTDDNRVSVMEVCKKMIFFIADELWVYGDSEGCRQEIEFAEMAGVKIVKKGEYHGRTTVY